MRFGRRGPSNSAALSRENAIPVASATIMKNGINSAGMGCSICTYYLAKARESDTPNRAQTSHWRLRSQRDAAVKIQPRRTPCQTERRTRRSEQIDGRRLGQFEGQPGDGEAAEL